MCDCKNKVDPNIKIALKDIAAVYMSEIPKSKPVLIRLPNGECVEPTGLWITPVNLNEYKMCGFEVMRYDKFVCSAYYKDKQEAEAVYNEFLSKFEVI